MNDDYPNDFMCEIKEMGRTALPGYKQVIKSPTRETKDSFSLIDLIFSNNPSNLLSTTVVFALLSDHDLQVYICTTKQLGTTEYQSIYFRYKIWKKRAKYFILVNTY